MNLHTLELFCIVAENQSISKAAKQVHISQPAVSSQIQSLEQFYDIHLFFRTTKGVKLTPAGEIVYESAKRMVQLHRKTIDSIKNCSTIANQIHVGVNEAFGNYILPGILTQFRHAQPNIQINLSILKTEEIIKGVIEGTIQMGIVEEELNPIIKLDSLQIGRDPIILAASPLQPITRKSYILINDLFQNLLILNTSESIIRKKVEHLFTHFNSTNRLQPLAEFCGIHAIKTAVIAGYGLSFFPKSTIEQEIAQGLLIPIEVKKESDYPLDITYHLIFDTEKMLVPAQHFLSYLLQKNNF